MRSLQSQYDLIVEGKGDKPNFKRNAIIALPKLISNFNSFEDVVTILSSKSIIKEAITDPKEASSMTRKQERLYLMLIE